MLNLDKIVKTISSEILYVILRVTGYVMFSVVLNLILLATQWDLILEVFNTELSNSKKIDSILVIIALFAFPILFFFLGQKQAIQKFLEKLLKTKKRDIVLFLVGKVYEKNPKIFDPAGSVSISGLKVIEYITEVFRDLPSIIVKVLSYFVEKTGFYNLFATSIEEYRSKSTDIADNNHVQVVSDIISNMIPGDVIRSNIKLPFMALMFNVSLFFL